MGGSSSKQFSPERDVPSLKGRVAIITGANSGIGFQIALLLASHGASVYLLVRSDLKATDAIRRMEAEDPALKGSSRLSYFVVDLTSVNAVKAAANAFLTKEGRLDILVNNAGMWASSYAETDEGVSTSVAANHLGHFALTTALLPLLESTAKQKGSDVRVVNVSSVAHSNAPKETKFSTVDDLRDQCAAGLSVDSFKAKMARYGHSKTANILFTKELQQRWDAEGIPAIAISLHPGSVATEGSHAFMKNILPSFVPRPLFAATAPIVKAESAKYGGAYLVPYGKIEQPSLLAQDKSLAHDLWATSEAAVASITAAGHIA